MVVRGRLHAAPGVHQLLAVLGLLGQVDQDQAEPPPVAEPEVGDVPPDDRVDAIVTLAPAVSASFFTDELLATIEIPMMSSGTWL